MILRDALPSRSVDVSSLGDHNDGHPPHRLPRSYPDSPHQSPHSQSTPPTPGHLWACGGKEMNSSRRWQRIPRAAN